MPRCHRIVAVLALVLAAWGGAAAAASEAGLLPTLGGSFGAAYDIDNAGRIVGYSTLAGDAEGHATYWANPAAAAFDLAPGRGDSIASRINDRGQIIGFPVPFYPQGLPGTWFWQQAGATPVPLAPLSPELTGQALAIDNAGKMAGLSEDINGLQAATTWNPPTRLDGDGTAASGLNDRGSIVGTARDANGVAHAVVWHDGSRTTLGDLPGASGVSVSLDINNAGSVAGTTTFPLTGSLQRQQATLWDHGQASALLVPAGAQSGANDIDEAGRVVGWTASALDRSDPFATLWQGSTATDLNSFLSANQRDAGWRLHEALALNDAGWIVGSAINRQLGQTRGFVLGVASIPEPASGAMALLGLAGLAVFARRRRVAGQLALRRGVAG